MIEDGELLKTYGRQGNEAAFESLVKRYVDLVYSAAWRQTGDREQHPQQQDDVQRAEQA